MPYIEQKDRARARAIPKTPGELNYAITELMIHQLHTEPPHDSFHEFYPAVVAMTEDYIADVGLSYTNGNAVMGVLDCASRELERRIGTWGTLRPDLQRQLRRVGHHVYDTILAPYEDEKIRENGDVYPEDVTTTKE